MEKNEIKQNYKFTIKDNIDYFIFFFYNIISSVKFQFSFKLKKILKNNRKLKNIHQNERCFILGTGPSLKKINFNDYKDEILFGVNNLFKMESIPHLDYYVMVDSDYVENPELKEDLKNCLKKLKDTKFFLNAKFINEAKNSGFNVNDLYFINAKLYQYKDKMSCDISSNMYVSHNVVSTSLLIALYMGFKEIYLLGCDYNSFASEINSHCYDKNNERVMRSTNLATHLNWYSKTTYAHYAIAKLAEKNDQRIINLTDNSLLDAYPKQR